MKKLIKLIKLKNICPFVRPSVCSSVHPSVPPSVLIPIPRSHPRPHLPPTPHPRPHHKYLSSRLENFFDLSIWIFNVILIGITSILTIFWWRADSERLPKGYRKDTERLPKGYWKATDSFFLSSFFEERAPPKGTSNETFNETSNETFNETPNETSNGLRQINYSSPNQITSGFLIKRTLNISKNSKFRKFQNFL